MPAQRGFCPVWSRDRMRRGVNLTHGRTRRSAATNPHARPARLPAGTRTKDRQEWRSLPVASSTRAIQTFVRKAG